MIQVYARLGLAQFTFPRGDQVIGYRPAYGLGVLVRATSVMDHADMVAEVL